MDKNDKESLLSSVPVEESEEDCDDIIRTNNCTNQDDVVNPLVKQQGREQEQPSKVKPKPQGGREFGAEEQGEAFIYCGHEGVAW